MKERFDIFNFENSGDLFLMKDKYIHSAGHNSNTPKTEEDFKKKLEEEEYKKSQGIKYWQKKYNIQKVKGVKKCIVKRELRYDKFLECLEIQKIFTYKHMVLSGILLEEVKKRTMTVKLKPQYQ
ncbi:hypothetical protein Glove_258g15 [Diversispora epigaea]|uniref:Uncharacterized protein n=1 Tax=Diversispora epigaea TaxID=1348612 RepID=A0A397IEE0_9GLOM|nr:hypothetical protein Glove_258g15 [Diversispora epigaea]